MMGNNRASVVYQDGRLGFLAIALMSVSSFVKGMKAEMQGKTFLMAFFKSPITPEVCIMKAVQPDPCSFP